MNTHHHRNLAFYLRWFRYESVPHSLREFLIPRLNWLFFVRVAVIVVVCGVIFGFVLTPAYINGASMEPTYRRIGVNFINRLKYQQSKPKRGDVVAIRYADRVMYLKRIIGLPGEKVEFRNGVLYVDGLPQDEPYVKNPCDWNLPPREVHPGNYYVVGDNRSMPIDRHRFGQVSGRRIIGGPIW